MARPAQRVEPGPGLRAGEFSWGQWEKYLTPQDMAAYRCLRQCALSTRQLGWRPFAQAIGGGTLEKPGIAKQRLHRIFDFLESVGLISCSENGVYVPASVIVNKIPGRPTGAQINLLTARKLRAEGPSHAIVDEFLKFFGERYWRKTGHAYPYKQFHRGNAIYLLKLYSLGKLKHLTEYYFSYMNPPHALGDFVRRIAVVVEECAEMDWTRM